MKNNKKETFESSLINLAGFAKALSHPARIAILSYLAERDTCICGEIVDILPFAQSTVSQHLKELKKAGLISGETEGPRSCYCINREKFRELKDLFNNISADILKNKKRCC